MAVKYLPDGRFEYSLIEDGVALYRRIQPSRRKFESQMLRGRDRIASANHSLAKHPCFPSRLPPTTFLAIWAAGAVALAGLQQLIGFPVLLGRSLTPIETGAAILAMYRDRATRRRNAVEAVLEDWLLHRIVGPLSEVLFRRRQSRWGYAFPGFHEALTPAARQRVLSRAEEQGVTGAGEQLFQLARRGQRR